MNRKESAEEQLSVETMRSLPEIRFCSVLDFLDFLNRKYSLIILIEIAFGYCDSFSDLLVRNPQISPRVLSMRLREYQKAGLLLKSPDLGDGRKTHYALTETGKDVIPILTSIIQYGTRNLASEMFKDRKPRELEELFPGMQKLLLGRLLDYAKIK